VDNATYLDVALRLANSPLETVDDLRAALHEEPWWSERVTSGDVEVLRSVASGLRKVLAAAVAADPAGVLAATNTLLAAHPLRPTLSAGHSVDITPHWHVHVADTDAPPATEVAAAASWGMAQGIVHHGLTRWGHCAADCDNYFLDTSTNQAKRFCSPRCANRVHVAAHRSRKRD
jgi:predicted RNA-binding Zn ribbon-like protein